MTWDVTAHCTCAVGYAAIRSELRLNVYAVFPGVGFSARWKTSDPGGVVMLNGVEAESRDAAEVLVKSLMAAVPGLFVPSMTVQPSS